MTPLKRQEDLRAAINEMAGNLNHRQVNEKQESDFLKRAKVNQAMQRDLMSHTSRAADMRDFQETDK